MDGNTRRVSKSSTKSRAPSWRVASSVTPSVNARFNGQLTIESGATSVQSPNKKTNESPRDAIASDGRPAGNSRLYTQQPPFKYHLANSSCSVSTFQLMKLLIGIKSTVRAMLFYKFHIAHSSLLTKFSLEIAHESITFTRCLLTSKLIVHSTIKYIYSAVMVPIQT